MADNKRGLLTRVAGHGARTILLDLPLLLLLLCHSSLGWIQHVHDSYLRPLLHAANWTEDRAFVESTYYRRVCTKDDMTTTNPDDLVVPVNATLPEIVDHQLLHGFSMFSSVVSPERANDLRDYVVRRNSLIQDNQRLYVIGKQNRYSFTLDPTVPVVKNAIREINDSLRPVLEAILGRNPAILELAVIASSYGAADQFWHQDTQNDLSAQEAANGFLPSFTLFVPLQNTTTGATHVCPGSHYCGDDDGFIRTEGFPMVPSTGYWAVGDALLMNQNAYHRGSGHTDPHAPDRVLLTITMAPRPRQRGETRQVSHGIPFSIGWDFFGHTLDDLLQADRVMTWPWKYMRSLGVYKLPGTEWGVDLVSCTIHRIVNDPNNFNTDAMQALKMRKVLDWIPQFLQPDESETQEIYDFLKGTVDKAEHWVFDTVMDFLRLYLVVLVLALIWMEAGFARFLSGMIRIVLMLLVVRSLSQSAIDAVDKSNWAHDVRHGRLYSDPYKLESQSDMLSWETSFPTKFDVLVDIRNDAGHLGIYRHFVKGHPGNRHLRDMIHRTTKLYLEYPFVFRRGLVTSLIGHVEHRQGRFLRQGEYGFWVKMNENQVKDYVEYELFLSGKALRSALRDTISSLMADVKYGSMRSWSMSMRHSIPALQCLENKVVRLSEEREGQSSFSAQPRNIAISILREPRARALLSGQISTRVERVPSLHPGKPAEEPYDKAWLKSGDITVVQNQTARILLVAANGATKMVVA